ncbi:MAG: acylneuraminate cytidylyltransferase family protein [Lachnospiraceae bacterium]|nr:acylneuraminate cytidylyltransferase family protein [Lachnospiraceae bacterium]
MNILFTICARAGSKGVKSKNTREFCGYPLVYYTLSAYDLFVKKYGKQYGSTMLVVNTDSDVLVQQMRDSNVEFTYVPREENLAGDVVAKIDVIRDTLLKVENKSNQKYDIVMDLDLTSPLRTAEDIKGTLDAILNDKQADISFSVTESRRSPYFNMVCEKTDGYFNTVIDAKFVSRQQVPVCYDMNASIYGYSREFLLSYRNHDRKAVIWKMKDTAVLDIDSEDDYEILGVLANYYIEKDEKLSCVKENIQKIIKIN